MLTKLKELSTQAKVAIGAGLAALLALGIGVAVWQPWNQPEEPDPAPVADQREPAAPQQPEDTGLSVRANGEDVPCTLYEGAGWSIYVPEGWESRPAGQNGAVFAAPDGAELEVSFQSVDGGTGPFVNLSPVDSAGRQLQFCDGIGDGSPVVTGRAAKSQWNRYEDLFAALAKTLAVGTETPFAESYVIPQEPDWQVAEGMTVLFQDKDGVILDDMAEKAVEEYMRTWPEEDRAVYTGQYRVNGIDWAASYTGLTDSYIDVFRARVQYRVAAEAEESAKARDGVTVVDGWASLPDQVYLVFTDDGQRTILAPETEDWVAFAERIR